MINLKWNEENIFKELQNIQKIINIQRMPTRIEVQSHGVIGLDSAITKYGGYIRCSENFKLARKISESYKWTEEAIENSVIKIINTEKSSTMPTSLEMEKFYGNKELSNAIASNGYKWWAEKLKLELKECETNFGSIWEQVCYEKLLLLSFEKVEKLSIKSSYDILVNDSVRIDVKSSSAYTGTSGYTGHTFALNKRLPTCDIYVLYALSKDGKNIERIFIVPSVFAYQVSISVGSKSSYDKYINRWDYIERYSDFYKTLKEV